jgi:hypothetical protein
VPGNVEPSPQPDLSSVWCASAGNCTAVGDYFDRSGPYYLGLLTQTSVVKEA